MSHHDWHLHLDAYLSVRQALGFQMRAERTLLRDFVGFVESHGTAALFGRSWPWTGPVHRQPSGAMEEPPNG